MIAHSQHPFDPRHNLNIEPAAKLIEHPGLVRALAFGVAAGFLASCALLLATMKISWSPERAPPDSNPFTIERWIEPQAAPPRTETRHTERRAENTQETQTAREEALTNTTTSDPTSSNGTGASTILQPRWLEQPNARDFERFYPTRALDRGIDGRVLLDCLVNADGRIGCTVASEDPQGMGFGEAARRISQSFRMAPQTVDGRPTDGGRVRVPISFRAQ